MNKSGKKFLLIFVLILIIATGCESKVEPINKTTYALGTEIHITVWTNNQQKGEEAIQKSFKRIQEIEERMSANIETSDVSLINKSAGVDWVDVHEDTAYVINKSLGYAKISKGAFDPTIGKLVKLWGIHTGNERVPTDSEIEDALAYVNYNLLDKKDETIFMLKKSGARIDLGGIAKGYAADEVYSILKDSGIKHGLINLGGNVLTLGKKVDGEKWRVGIQNPYAPTGTHIAIAEVSDETVVTSGNYERYFIKDGIRYHHIIDTKTGYPSKNGIIGATIITSKSIDADALSTSVYTLGVESGLKLIEELEGVETMIITEENKVYISSGLEKVITMVDDKFSIAE